MKISKEELLKVLSGVAALIEKRPWWEKNMLDEYNKSTCDTPRIIQKKQEAEKNKGGEDG